MSDPLLSQNKPEQGKNISSNKKIKKILIISGIVIMVVFAVILFILTGFQSKDKIFGEDLRYNVLAFAGVTLLNIAAIFIWIYRKYEDKKSIINSVQIGIILCCAGAFAGIGGSLISDFGTRALVSTFGGMFQILSTLGFLIAAK